MEGDFIKINEWLKPLSWIYGAAVNIRNAMFDMGILKSRAFTTPVIAVGNITVGGTGKTPHVEYLVRLLKEHVKLAVLSRGYKRKTKGMIIAKTSSTISEIGDEPLQMKQKFPDVTVVVDKNRVRAIEQLTEKEKENDIDVIVLDDAFQHRYVKPGINILLVDYHRLIIYDALLPAGRLREPLSGKNRADIVVVTKCPTTLKPMDYRVITKAMNLYPYQQLYFSTLTYAPLEGMFNRRKMLLEELKNINLLLFTGIASPEQISLDLEKYKPKISHISFPDHHYFTAKDIERTANAFARMPEPKIIVTTEKDATRLKALDNIPENLKQAIFVLPVRINFMLGQEEKFNENIIGYVRKNSRNSILAKGKDDNKSDHRHNFGNGTWTTGNRNY